MNKVFLRDQLQFLLVTAIGIVVGVLFPHVFMPLAHWTSVLLACSLFALATMVQADDIRVSREHLGLLLATPLLKYIISLLAFTFIRYAAGNQLSVADQTGLFLIAIAPSAVSSILLSFVTGSNYSFSVVCTLFNSLISPLLIFFACAYYLEHSVFLNIKQHYLSLIVNVIFPLLLGAGYQRSVPLHWQTRTAGILKKMPLFAIALIIAIIVAKQPMSKTLMTPFCWTLVYYLLCFVMSAVVVTPLASVNSVRDAFTIEVMLANLTVSTYIALTFFSSPVLGIIFCAILLQNLLTFILVCGKNYARRFVSFSTL